MVNGLIAELIIAGAGRQAARGQVLRRRLFTVGQLVRLVIVTAAVISAILYGRWRIAQSGECVEAGPVVASVQSNVAQSVKRTFEEGAKIFAPMMEDSKAAAAAGAELIVWPETMVQATLNPEVLEIVDDSHLWKAMDEALRDHSKDTAAVLVGAYGGVWDHSKEQWSRRYNSAFLYNRDGSQYGRHYNKIHLVPFGEVLPFKRSLPWLYNILMKFTPYDYDYSLDYGSEYTVFEMLCGPEEAPKSHRFSVIICYEDVVPYVARNFALDEHGAKQIDWLVNISNDGWFVIFDEDTGKVRRASTELPQHAAICVFRAVENRLAVVRSVNTGISCLIDSLGNIRNEYAAGTLPVDAMARTGMAGWFADRMPIDKRVTFFSKYGPWLDFCCEGCVVLFIIASLLARLLGAGRFGIDLSGRSNGRRAQRIQGRY